MKNKHILIIATLIVFLLFLRNYFVSHSVDYDYTDTDTNRITVVDTLHVNLYNRVENALVQTETIVQKRVHYVDHYIDRYVENYQKQQAQIIKEIEKCDTVFIRDTVFIPSDSVMIYNIFQRSGYFGNISTDTIQVRTVSKQYYNKAF